MSRRPLIALPMRVQVDPGKAPALRQNQAYALALERAGGLPLFVPPLSAAEVEALLEHAHGVLLTGGPDVEPAWYGEKRSEEWPVAVDAVLDALERQMAQWALDHDAPVLGVCRGVQLLNVVAGGDLYQDLPAQRPEAIPHEVRQHGRAHLAHEVSIAPDSKLASLVGAQPLAVNSLHHQGVRRVAPGWEAVAWTSDGLVEAIELNTGRSSLALGVQWHPEEMLAGREGARSLALFTGLVTSSRPAAGAAVPR